MECDTAELYVVGMKVLASQSRRARDFIGGKGIYVSQLAFSCAKTANSHLEDVYEMCGLLSREEKHDSASQRKRIEQKTY